MPDGESYGQCRMLATVRLGQLYRPWVCLRMLSCSFVAGCERFLRGSDRQTANRIGVKTPSVEEYIQIRRDSVAVYLSFGMAVTILSPT
jgi:hypothetical protein